MGLDIACKTHWVGCIVVETAADLLGIFADDREAGIDLGQTLVSQRVGTSDIGGNVAVRCREVGQDWFGKAVVALVGKLERLGTIGVALEEADAIRDNRVGGQVLRSG